MKRSERLYEQSRRLALHALVFLSAGTASGAWGVVAIREQPLVGCGLIMLAALSILFAGFRVAAAEHIARLADEERWAERRRETRPRL